ncbi:MAG: FAD-dependent thymidylate synthase, partial [Candidatus Falkowbacteria bacterium]|nr:FAD-dependent thymidylate synthase [Candidatus Falkowbacteria bacterium]
ETIYEKALKARSFDILRSFLPAGITTQLSWHTNLRQAFDKISLLRHHPLKETREIAETIHNKLKEKYPHSFSHELAEPQENYRQFLNNNYNYYVSDFPEVEFACRTNIKNHELEYYMDIFDSRPERIGLPHFLTELGHVTFDFKLDYGSFRDIQRHRNGVCRMPILTTDLSFNTWYLNQMPDDLQREAINLINNQIKLISKLDCPSTIKQYYIALGFNVACRVTYGLPAALYTIELRSGRMVHPTLRTVAHKMHHALKEKFPDLTLYCDLSLDDWDVRRGLQDITER